ncbi:MAG: hypothetical protein H6735_23260 [Alphaproteobacteria bacterium]|nr:hypothetical protein [Alphaproteobacteria bacterium]
MDPVLPGALLAVVVVLGMGVWAVQAIEGDPAAPHEDALVKALGLRRAGEGYHGVVDGRRVSLFRDPGRPRDTFRVVVAIPEVPVDLVVRSERGLTTGKAGDQLIGDDAFDARMHIELGQDLGIAWLDRQTREALAYLAAAGDLLAARPEPGTTASTSDLQLSVAPFEATLEERALTVRVRFPPQVDDVRKLVIVATHIGGRRPLEALQAMVERDPHPRVAALALQALISRVDDPGPALAAAARRPPLLRACGCVLGGAGVDHLAEDVTSCDPVARHLLLRLLASRPASDEHVLAVLSGVEQAPFVHVVWSAMVDAVVARPTPPTLGALTMAARRLAVGDRRGFVADQVLRGVLPSRDADMERAIRAMLPLAEKRADDARSWLENHGAARAGDLSLAHDGVGGLSDAVGARGALAESE